jgi:hypothetical protein
MTTFEITQIVIGSGLALGTLRLIFSLGKISQKIDVMSEDISQLKRDTSSIDRRLSHLEGAFNERGYWESRRTGSDKKD